MSRHRVEPGHRDVVPRSICGFIQPYAGLDAAASDFIDRRIRIVTRHRGSPLKTNKTGCMPHYLADIRNRKETCARHRLQAETGSVGLKPWQRFYPLRNDEENSCKKARPAPASTVPKVQREQGVRRIRLRLVSITFLRKTQSFGGRAVPAEPVTDA